MFNKLSNLRLPVAKKTGTQQLNHSTFEATNKPQKETTVRSIAKIKMPEAQIAKAQSWCCLKLFFKRTSKFSIPTFAIVEKFNEVYACATTVSQRTNENRKTNHRVKTLKKIHFND